MERAIAWLMTVVAAAGMTAYADGLERPRTQVTLASTPAVKAKTPAPQEDGAPQTAAAES